MSVSRSKKGQNLGFKVKISQKFGLRSKFLFFFFLGFAAQNYSVFKSKKGQKFWFWGRNLWVTRSKKGQNLGFKVKISQKFGFKVKISGFRFSQTKLFNFSIKKKIKNLLPRSKIWSLRSKLVKRLGSQVKSNLPSDDELSRYKVEECFQLV